MKIGKVTSVNYSQIKVKISSEIKGGSVNLHGDVYYFGNIGSYLKVYNAVDEAIICEVIAIFDSDVYLERQSFNVESNRELLLKPIGTINKKTGFALGVGIFPSLYSDVSIVTYGDMNTILTDNIAEDEPSKDKGKVHTSFYLGQSKNLINYKISVGIDRFFNIHSAVLGNSGSGKSNSIAHIIQQIHAKKDFAAKGSRILIFDVSGEYTNAFPGSNEFLNVKYFKPNIPKPIKSDNGAITIQPFFMPHFLMSLDEWSAFLMAADASQRPFWDKVLQESYRFYKVGYSTDIEKEKFVNYLRHRICVIINSILSQADTDTSRITTAAGVLANVLSIINSDDKIISAATDLTSDIKHLQSACTLDFGKNNNKLQNAINEIKKNVDVVSANEVAANKIKSNEYFNYEFLKIAAELILLEEDARGNRQIRGYTATMLTRLDFFLDNPDCRFMRKSNAQKKVDDYLDFLWKCEENDQRTQLVIIDTSELSPDVLETLTSVTSRLLFDNRKNLSGDERRKKPIHLILDEAHRYIKKNHDYLLKENIFEKIAREGRKFSLFLLVSSQRPSELSETVLSQCANFIVHRIQNETDMRYIQAILPYFSDDFTNKIKQSTPGEALVFGNCVSMPLHIKVQEANPSPDSKNCNIPEQWFIK